MGSWFSSKGYMQGVFWSIMVCMISSMNDVCLRLLGRLHGLQISFLRFAISAAILFPIMMWFNRSSFKTVHLKFHALRSLFIYAAIICWSTGVGVYQSPLALSSTLAQTTALFVLPMAYVFLHEKISWQCLLATIAGFVGILIAVQPENFTFSLQSFFTLNYGALFLIAAAILFAVSDILNKVLVNNEGMLTMMFYIAIGAALIGCIPAYVVWQDLTASEWAATLVLGCGANLILYCLLKAFSATKISDLMPYRYLELVFATFVGYVLFGERLETNLLIGASIIVVSTFTIGWYETKHQN